VPLHEDVWRSAGKAPRVVSPSTRCGWVSSISVPPLNPRRKNHQYTLGSEVGESRSRLGVMVRKCFCEMSSSHGGEHKAVVWYVWDDSVMILMMEAVIISETSVNFYHIARCNIPEDNHSCYLLCKSKAVLLRIQETRWREDISPTHSWSRH
jgi:hypothetical protein